MSHAEVTIPRAQYDALIGAINDFVRKQDAWSVARARGTQTVDDGFELEAAYQRLKALRATGIDLENSKS